MQLKLKNIGMIKEADITIDGLTVIAGENDTGKSTVGKALYLVLSSLQNNRGTLLEDDPRFMIKYTRLIELLFEDAITDGDGEIILVDGTHEVHAEFYNHQDSFETPLIAGMQFGKYEVMMIETPIVWSYFKFFNSIEKMKTEASFFNQNYQIPYPYLMWDIYRKLSLSKNEELIFEEKKLLLEKIEAIIDGKFTKNNFGDFIFLKGDKKIPIINTATGIKQFGILQKLVENNYLHTKSVLILDEPEVHLHPKWQLKMAEVIVQLVRNGVKVLVNSHSPYMIEALQRYSDKASLESNFYLAEGGKISQIENSNEETISQIFKKLSEPFDIFEAMDSESLLNG